MPTERLILCQLCWRTFRRQAWLQVHQPAQFCSAKCKAQARWEVKHDE